jgi:hypothetical protein
LQAAANWFRAANARFRRGQTRVLTTGRAGHLIDSIAANEKPPDGVGRLLNGYLGYFFSSSRVTATAPMAESRTLLPSTPATSPRSI